MGVEAAAGFLGTPYVSELVFYGLVLAPFATAFVGCVTGTAGGLLLLALMAQVFPPVVLVPVHTVVQLGAGCTRVLIMWRHVMVGTLFPFLIGAVVGAAAGAQVFIILSAALLQGIIGGVILFLTWAPAVARTGPERMRFGFLGFGATFLGMFVSATGTMLSPFVASAAPDRRNYAATFAALMALVHVAKLAAFSFLGVAFGAYLPLIGLMIVSATFGNWVGARVLERIPERCFRMVFKVLLSTLAVRLLWVAARDSGYF